MPKFYDIHNLDLSDDEQIFPYHTVSTYPKYQEMSEAEYRTKKYVKVRPGDRERNEMSYTEHDFEYIRTNQSVKNRPKTPRKRDI
jgi:hypothetical protein